jgi:hypothetical protein
MKNGRGWQTILETFVAAESAETFPCSRLMCNRSSHPCDRRNPGEKQFRATEVSCPGWSLLDNRAQENLSVSFQRMASRTAMYCRTLLTKPGSALEWNSVLRAAQSKLFN